VNAEVDVVIPVHRADRPIARAVGSILDHTRAQVRVTVVCHEVATAEIAQALGSASSDPQLRLLAHRDGTDSPAGPINAGLDAASAPFTALLDSDDTYEPGAIDAWLGVQRRDDAEAVIPMFRYADAGSARTPPTRPGRRRRLDGVRDRLAYRTRMHGLVARSRFGDVRMTPGLATGEDVLQGARVWFSDARISFARRAPGYLVHLDASERASATPRPARDSLAFLDAVLSPELNLTDRQCEALVIKVLRTHVMDVARSALDAAAPHEQLDAVADSLRRLRSASPGAASALSRRDGRILEQIERTGRDLRTLAQDLAVRTDYRRPANLVPSDPRRILAREAPLRLVGAVALSP
jgi:hypothetical protein